MDEEKAGGGGGGEIARVSPSFDAVGGRQRFTVELRPGETTIVSWKKLAKDANKVKGSKSVPEQAPSNALPALESRIAPGEPAENEEKDAPPATRFSAVIEKIERLYMGKHSSDEEDLNDVPDDDEYDTEDSFIDDTELDEYFQVDNSAIKHNGFFVNRGKLERINEPISSPHQQPKKRRKKDLAKGYGENSDGNLSNRPAKVGKKAAGRSLPLAGKNSFSHSHSVAVPVEHSEDVKFHDQMNAAVISSKKKSGYNKTTLDPSFSKVSNGNAASSLAGEKDIDMQKTGVLVSKNYINKLKDGSEFNDASFQRSHEKSSFAQFKPQSGRLLNNVDELEQSVQRKEKNGIHVQPDINVPDGKYSMQTTKAPVMHRREGSSVRPKSTMLEKAIKELEKMVVESARPPTMEVPDADISSQAVKRRLPHEVKQKLAKVARLAQASHGKISKELINRLMGILGNSIQLRTLKRNLKVMVSMDLSAKQENEGRFQQIKKEVVEMIKVRVLSPKPKALEQQAGISDDFQEIVTQEKEERKCGMDDALEEKICDLYDLYVEGLDEDAGPQVRKLYAELAELWPNGLMTNHGIKRAICRAKDRRRALYNRQKDQEKIKRKKLLTAKTEETIHVESSCIAQAQYMQEKLVTDSGNHGITSLNRPVANTTTCIAARMPNTLVNDPGLDQPKQEKVKGSLGNSIDTRTVEALTKKKVKRKPELDMGETHFRPEKLTSAQGEERHKSHKQFPGLLQKPNLQSAPPPPPPPHPHPPSFEQQG